VVGRGTVPPQLKQSRIVFGNSVAMLSEVLNSTAAWQIDSGSLGNGTDDDSTTATLCPGGTYNDGTCVPVWPLWVNVGVPLICIAVFLLTLLALFLRTGTARKKNSKKSTSSTKIMMQPLREVKETSSQSTAGSGTSDGVSTKLNGVVSQR